MTDQRFSRDFYWRRDGLRWVVGTVYSDGDGWRPEAVLMRCWRERTAAQVSSICFQAYLDGQDIQRARSAATS